MTGAASGSVAAAAFVAVAEDLFPGFYIVEKTKRYYPEDPRVRDVCPVLIGKTGLPSKEELEPWDDHSDQLEELSLKEIAAVLEITEAAAQSRYRRGVERLHGLLSDDCKGDSDDRA